MNITIINGKAYSNGRIPILNYIIIQLYYILEYFTSKSSN